MMFNQDGSQTKGIPAEAMPVTVGADIKDEWSTTLQHDVEGSITGVDHNGATITVTSFTIKMTGGFLFKKITAVTGLGATDLILVR